MRTATAGATSPAACALTARAPSPPLQATKAADLVVAAVRFMLTLEAGRLNPDVYWALAKPLARNPLYQRLVAAAPRSWAYATMYAVGACA